MDDPAVQTENEDQPVLLGVTAEVSPEELEAANRTSKPHVDRWNKLVSNTNWEKGRIIAQWRQDLIESHSPATEYSDTISRPFSRSAVMRPSAS